MAYRWIIGRIARLVLLNKASINYSSVPTDKFKIWSSSTGIKGQWLQYISKTAPLTPVLAYWCLFIQQVPVAYILFKIKISAEVANGRIKYPGHWGWKKSSQHISRRDLLKFVLNAPPPPSPPQELGRKLFNHWEIHFQWKIRPIGLPMPRTLWSFSAIYFIQKYRGARG